MVRELPTIEIPDFPDPTGVVEFRDGGAFMPLDYYEAIYLYKIGVDEAFSVYRRIKETWNGKNVG